jgi:hypothetical protein
LKANRIFQLTDSTLTKHVSADIGYTPYLHLISDFSFLLSYSEIRNAI